MAATTRLAARFVERNRVTLSDIGAEMEYGNDGASVSLILRTGSTIGAVPLTSPTSYQPDVCFVVRPRFDWAGLGAMLHTMGWKIAPSALRLPNLPASERDIPAWVISATVVARIERLVRRLQRRFELIDEIRAVRRGTIDWARYVAHMARARYLDVPCRYPDLRDDSSLRAAVRYAL
jgi:hypothetical protein